MNICRFFSSDNWTHMYLICNYISSFLSLFLFCRKTMRVTLCICCFIHCKLTHTDCFLLLIQGFPFLSHWTFTDFHRTLCGFSVLVFNFFGLCVWCSVYAILPQQQSLCVPGRPPGNWWSETLSAHRSSSVEFSPPPLARAFFLFSILRPPNVLNQALTLSELVTLITYFTLKKITLRKLFLIINRDSSSLFHLYFIKFSYWGLLYCIIYLLKNECLQPNWCGGPLGSADSPVAADGCCRQ